MDIQALLVHVKEHQKEAYGVHTAPEELEMRLRNALKSAAPQRSKQIAQMWKVALYI